MDSTVWQQILNPDHLTNAKEFMNFLKHGLRLNGETLKQYFARNQLGLTIIFPPQLNINYVGEGDSFLSEFASEIKAQMDLQDIESATSTTVILSVPLGNLNLREDILAEGYEKIADQMVTTNEILQKIDPENTTAKTRDQILAELWQEHLDRREFLNPQKLAELRQVLINLVYSEDFNGLLKKYNGQISLAKLEGDDGVLIEFRFKFE